MDRMLKVKDIQEIFDCGINKAYQIVGQKDFPKIVIGRTIYIPEEGFNKWVKNYTGREYKL